MASKTLPLPNEEVRRIASVNNNEDGQLQDLLTGSTSNWASIDSGLAVIQSNPLTEKQINIDKTTPIPIRQHDLSNQSSSMDASTDFSFLRKRSGSVCSQVQQYLQPRTPTTASVLSDAGMTPQSTPRRSNNNATPTSGPAPRPTLSQQQRRRKMSSSTQTGLRPAGNRSTTNTASGSKMKTLLANTRRLPLHLPRPNLCVISDPYADLCTHLKKHGMHVEAEEFAAAGGITTDFALRTWIQISAGGAEGLLNQTNTFLSQHSSIVQAQISSTKETSHRVLPSHFTIPVANIDRHADEQCLTPTHILAVQGISIDEDSKGLLLPCHALMYALQCVSLPAFPTSHGRREGEQQRSLPVSALRVPRPTEFPALHAYLYTHDASALLLELLPMKHIARHLDLAKAKQLYPTNMGAPFLSSSSKPAPSIPSSAVHALAYLPAQSLLAYAYKIHSAYANGVAIGLLRREFWSTLNQAWSLIMAALAIKAARRLDAERKGAQPSSIPNTS